VAVVLGGSCPVAVVRVAVVQVAIVLEPNNIHPNNKQKLLITNKTTGKITC